jgi:hypothetical protein
MSPSTAQSSGTIAPIANVPTVPGTEPSTAAGKLLVLTPEQGQSPWLELRDHNGKTLGFLARSGETSHYFTVEEMEEVKRRAQTPSPGKTFAEILESVRKRIEG